MVSDIKNMSKIEWVGFNFVNHSLDTFPFGNIGVHKGPNILKIPLGRRGLCSPKKALGQFPLSKSLYKAGTVEQGGSYLH